MTPRRTRRENTSERRRAYREPRERVLVVCGGRRTEPDYRTDVVAEINDARGAAVMLRRFVPGYDKTCVRFEDDFAQGVQEAVERGRSLLPDTTVFGPNPSTGVWRLVERISASVM